jgi:hypothetical protein
LAGTFALALLLLIAVSTWLLTDPQTSRSEALKTGGLAAGSVIALYALWLNDRRRRVEERRQEVEFGRHEVERRRAEYDRERLSDERFSRSIELLGHEADQSRTGALHSLAGLARSRPDYTQTVLDVLCAYLRRPFDHPRYHSEKAAGPDDTDDPASERELQVRLTAQRLIIDLLPAAGSGGPAFDLDLTGAALEYFDLSHRKVGSLVLRYAYLYSLFDLRGCEVAGPAWFTEAKAGRGRLSGQVRAEGALFRDLAWFSGTRFGAVANFSGTTFTGRVTFKEAEFAADALLPGANFGDTLELRGTRFEGLADLRLGHEPKAVAFYNTLLNPARDHTLPPSWTTERLPSGWLRLTTREG